MGLFKYLRPTFEGKDGKASMKKMTIFLCVFLFTFAFFGDFFFDYDVDDLKLELISTIIVVGILGNQAQSIASDFKPNKDENIG